MQKPSVVILGTGIPEELVMAAGAEPYWLIGGSLGSVAWSDDIVPRDTDPVSRSILGYIHQPKGADFSGSLFVIPLTSDSMRKIAYQLKSEGRKICIVDIPPSRDDIRADPDEAFCRLAVGDSGHGGFADLDAGDDTSFADLCDSGVGAFICDGGCCVCWGKRCLDGFGFSFDNDNKGRHGDACRFYRGRIGLCWQQH